MAMRQEGKPQFGRIPWELVDSGYLKKLTGRECKLLMALAAHMNGDWTGNPRGPPGQADRGGPPEHLAPDQEP